MDNLVIILAAVAALSVIALVVVVLRRPKDDGQAAAQAEAQAAVLAQTLEQLRQTTESLRGQQVSLGNQVNNTQEQMDRRLDALHQRLGEGLQEQTKETGKTLAQLGERLAVIDSAQKTITDLSQQMVGLQNILSNKQARGAFGELQMTELVSDILPTSAYEFQATLGNKKRVDCLLKLPNPPGPIAIDAKFPLESYKALQEAVDDGARHIATKAFQDALKKHISDIAERYIVSGETADSAIMFLPSETMFAEIHTNPKLSNLLEECRKRRVWIVSPNTLMATLTTIRAVLRDAKMKEQAGLIQKEVAVLLKDVGRLNDRVSTLRKRFDSADSVIKEIEISRDKVTGRGQKIEAIELEDDSTSADTSVEVAASDDSTDPNSPLKLV